MAIYTYEVDHGDNSPEITAGMELMGGKLVAVEFGPKITEPDWVEKMIAKNRHRKFEPQKAG